jgi:hypothetical protein
MTTEPSVLRCYGLGANHIGNSDPIGSLELFKETATIAPSMPCPQHYPTVPSLSDRDNYSGSQRSKTVYSYYNWLQGNECLAGMD